MMAMAMDTPVVAVVVVATLWVMVIEVSKKLDALR